MTEFKMPSLGADMEAGTLVEWTVKPGAVVKRGDVVAVVETDKGAIDVEIWQSGVVDELKVAAGTTVPVGTVLATLREDGAAAKAVAAPAVAPNVPAATAPSAAPVAPVVAPAASRVAPAPPPSVPSAAPVAVASAVFAAASRAPAPAAAASPAPVGHVRASPSARQLARERGVDLATLHGTGPSGAITRSDVEHAVTPPPAPTAPTATAPPTAAAPAPAPRAAARAAAPSAMRQAIAAAMSRANREIPHYYVATHIDVAALQAWLARENLRRSVDQRLLPIVPLVKAVARALVQYPELNGFYVDGAFQPSPAVHLGFAVALRGGGLIAPAIHDCEQKSLDELQAAVADLIRRTRAGALRSSELSDPTVTVTSLGERGVETVFGIIHPPQVALVGLGKIADRPWAVDGLLGVRPILHATLAADHRVSDGHRGALFLDTLAKLLAEPEKL